MANTSQGAYEFMVLQYDGNGLFRVLEATPATAQAIGMIGSAGISHWSFPAVSSYDADRCRQRQCACRASTARSPTWR